MRSRTLALALALPLAACATPASKGIPARGGASAAPAVGPAKAEGQATEGAKPATPQGSPLGDRPAIPTAPQAKAQGFALPPQVHLSMPEALLKGSAAKLLLGEEGIRLLANDGGGLLANDGGGLLASDGGSLLANDGGGLLANDGGGLLANDGGGIVAGGAGNLRLLPELGPPRSRPLLQNQNTLEFVDLMLSMWQPQQEVAQLLTLSMAFYGYKVNYLNQILKHLQTVADAKRFRSGEVLGLQLKIEGPLTVQTKMNVVPTGSGGSPSHPILWLYNVDRVQVGGPMPTSPTIAVELTGPGQGRIVWRPDFSKGEGRGFWAQTRFDLKAQQTSSDLAMVGATGQRRHLSVDTHRDAQGRWAADWTATVDTGATDAVYRRASLLSDGPGLRAGLQAAPLIGGWPGHEAFSWLQPDGKLGPKRFHHLNGEGQLEEGPSEGPDPSAPGFGQGGLRPGAMVGLRRDEEASSHPFFAWPATPPDARKLTPVLP